MSLTLRDGRSQESYHLNILKQNDEQETVTIPGRMSPDLLMSTTPVERLEQQSKNGRLEETTQLQKLYRCQYNYKRK